MSTASKLVEARRAVELLRLRATGATEDDIRIWQAGHLVADLETAVGQSAVAVARRSALVMDLVLSVVAVLAMGFSLGNIHTFALMNEVTDPIAWFLAPAIDLALCAALLGDAVLSRFEINAGPWATRLRWYAAAATLTLNTWKPWVSLNPASIVLHTALPVLLFILAEAANPYREAFAQTVRLAAAAALEARTEELPYEVPEIVPEPVQAPVAAVEAPPEEAQVSPRSLSVAAEGVRPKRTVVRAARLAASQTARESYEHPEELELQRKEARERYEKSVTDGSPLGASALGRLYGRSEGWGRKQIAAVQQSN